jgi:cysteine synthase
MMDTWVQNAIKIIHADFTRSADTHLIKLPLPQARNIDLYLKDESTHLTGSLKHRLARSLFLYALCNGWIKQGMPIIEASSGSTAVSEAYFSRLIGVRFIAVMAKSTSPEKIKRVEHYGGECVFVDNPSQDCAKAKELSQSLKGHFMDQFTYAERATDWRGNNNIAESIFEQMKEEPFPEPSWIICGAGTGGTSATLGRYVRYAGHATQVCVVDPVNSTFFEYYKTNDCNIKRNGPSGVEGIGRPQVEKSFIPTIVDRMIQVPNAATYASIHFLEKILGKKCGGSTGTNLYGTFQIINEMMQNNESGSVVTLICDSGDLYLDTYYNHQWLSENGHEIGSVNKQLETFYNQGSWQALASK